MLINIVISGYKLIKPSKNVSALKEFKAHGKQERELHDNLKTIMMLRNKNVLRTNTVSI